MTVLTAGRNGYGDGKMTSAREFAQKSHGVNFPHTDIDKKRGHIWTRIPKENAVNWSLVEKFILARQPTTLHRSPEVSNTKNIYFDVFGMNQIVA